MGALGTTSRTMELLPPSACALLFWESRFVDGFLQESRMDSKKMSEYRSFIRRKSQMDAGDGFEPLFMPDFLFDFQAHLVDWSVRTGRSAKFADCGMGKTPMKLVWAENVVRKTNKPVLDLNPLSAAQQTVEEAAKFDIDAVRCADGKFAGNRIIVTNYERLRHFNPDDFGGVVCDESSIIKNFEGARKSEITEFMKKVRYRLLCTATAAPNDYIELGTSSEALGYLGYMDMLSTFFKNDQDSLHPAFIGSQWRFKRHGESQFWRWMSSWARACRRPSDIGFSDERFVLPKLNEIEHKIASPIPRGQMFEMPAVGLAEQRADTKATIIPRCEYAAGLLQGEESGVAWCHRNDEADLLVRLIPGSKQVSGSNSDEEKEELFQAFRSGELRVLVTKPKIAAWGLNWQHCNRMTYFPDYSFEQYYQAVRRFWRFGQTRDVEAHMVTSTAQLDVLRSLQKKSEACDVMFASLVAQMNDALKINRMQEFSKETEIPSWL